MRLVFEHGSTQSALDLALARDCLLPTRTPNKSHHLITVGDDALHHDRRAVATRLGKQLRERRLRLILFLLWMGFLLGFEHILRQFQHLFWVPGATPASDAPVCPACDHGRVACICDPGQLLCATCIGQRSVDCPTRAGAGKVVRCRDVLRRFETRIHSQALSFTGATPTEARMVLWDPGRRMLLASGSRFKSNPESEQRTLYCLCACAHSW
jgi:hypothetical protein